MQDQTDRIVRPAEAENLTGYCDVHLRRLEARGEFPRRFKLSDQSGPYGAAGWLLSDIAGWLKVRAASRPSTFENGPEAAPGEQSAEPTVEAT